MVQLCQVIDSHKEINVSVNFLKNLFSENFQVYALSPSFSVSL